MGADKKNILVVDDEPGFGLLLKMNLERTGNYSVQTLNDPLKTLDSIRSQRPDLIILDMVMPGLDGGELSALIRTEEHLSDIPIIFLTALVSKEDGAEEAVGRYGDRVLIGKPVDLDVLIQSIETELATET